MSFYQIELPNELDEIDNIPKLKLYQNQENYKISVFLSHFPTVEGVESNWKRVSSYIASMYQSKLTRKEKEFEKWNIYLIFICADAVYKELRFEIENDKFSTRKIIVGELPADLDEKRYNSLISQHISNDDLVINPAIQSEDLQNILSKYQSSTFIWEMIKDEESLNYKTQSQKDILVNIISRIKNENK